MTKKFQKTVTEVPTGCEAWAGFISGLDHEINLNDRNQTRRHEALYFKKDGEEFEVPIEDKTVDIVGGFIAEESYNELLAFIRGFSEKQRRLVFLLEDGLSVREIAEELDMSDKAVYKLRDKVREKIKSFKREG